MSTVIEILADYAGDQAEQGLSEEVLHHAKRAVLDWFAALYPGTRVAPAQNLVRAHRAELGVGKASLPGFGARAFPALAAWINGTASHAVEFDDIFRDAVYHPGVPTISAALAVAESEARSGLDLLEAVTVGYEISTRIGAAVQPSHYRYFHTTGTVGCFGSAAAAAYLLAPHDRQVVAHAMATAGSCAAALQQAFRSDSMTKAIHGGHAASVGVVAAMAAKAGVTGALDILEGEVGFGAALANSPSWFVATDGLGEQFNITRITQKSHGCCGHTFAAIDAALEIRTQMEPVDPAMVKEILVETYQTAIDVTGNYSPQSSYQAKFSLPYVVARALLSGSVRLDAFSEQSLADPAVCDLMARVILADDAELSAGFPRMRAARVRVILADGRVFEHFSPYRKGDPESPLSDGELNDKFDALVGPVIGSGAAASLREKIWSLDRIALGELRLVV